MMTNRVPESLARHLADPKAAERALDRAKALGAEAEQIVGQAREVRSVAEDFLREIGTALSAELDRRPYLVLGTAVALGFAVGRIVSIGAVFDVARRVAAHPATQNLIVTQAAGAVHPV